jgi:RecB family exonuclease
MPERSDKVHRLQEETEEYGLPYISKSRVMQWQTNPEHYRLKYMEGIREPETEAMRRGTSIHEVFEDYYANLVDYIAGAGDVPAVDEIAELLPEHTRWSRYTVPYIKNFIQFEARRAAACEKPQQMIPIAIEDEMWRDPVLGLDDEPEWMGLADAIYDAASVPAVAKNSGAVVVDFKTGKVPQQKYRDDGIHMELEYYVMLFEAKYDVATAGAYYPRADEFLVQPDDPSFRTQVEDAVTQMVKACREYDGDTNFDTKEGPLCKWGPSDDEESAYYGICSKCTWGVPANNPETFKQMVKEGYGDWEIAESLGTSTDAVNYWRYKMDL